MRLDMIHYSYETNAAPCDDIEHRFTRQIEVPVAIQRKTNTSRPKMTTTLKTECSALVPVHVELNSLRKWRRAETKCDR